jgi:hypothetical protein
MKNRETNMQEPGDGPVMEPDPVIEAYKRHIDRTLLRENLKLTVEQRFLKLQDLQRWAAELQRAGRRAKP